MPREEQAGRAARFRGKPKASCDKRFLHLDLAEGGGEGAGFQPLFQGPSRIKRAPCLDDENECGVEAEGDEAGSVRRAPFASGPVGQAPQERCGAVPPDQAITEKGEGKGESRRLVAIGGRLDLVQAGGCEFV